MNSKRILASAIAAAALVASSGAYADDSSTGSVSGTGTSASGTAAPQYRTGAVMREIGKNAREMREAVKGVRQEIRTETKSGCVALKQENSELRDSVKTNWNAFHTQFGKVKSYLKTDLSTDEKTAISKIWTTHVQARQAIVSGTGSEAEKILALKSALQTALDGLKPYVAADKADAYAAFETERLAVLERNAAARAEMAANRAECKTIRETAKTTVAAKISTIADEYVAKFVTAVRTGLPTVPAERQAKVYGEIVKRIDALLAKPLSETSKTSLTQLRAEVQAKIDALASVAG